VTGAEASRRRLVWWLILVIGVATLESTANLAGGAPDRNVLYRYSTAVGSAIVYAVLLLIVLGIAGWRLDLLALRRPASWLRALGLAVVVFIAAEIAIQVMEPFLHGGREQGLVPKHWEPRHAAAYAVNWLIVAGVAPLVEELTYRGLGFSLLERYGKWPAIVVVGLLFAAAHGLVQAFPEFAALGCGLAWLRSRTASVYPGIVLHSTFNSIALAAVFFHT
jgi:membrane protease YdiL (CAAX protease family)